MAQSTPVEGWGDNLHRLLAQTGAEDANDDDAGQADYTSVPKEEQEVQKPQNDPPFAQLPSRRTTGASRRRISRVLPVRTSDTPFPPIASAFDIYVEPDMPIPVASSSSNGETFPITQPGSDTEDEQRSETMSVSGTESSLLTPARHSMALSEPALDTTARRDSSYESPVDPGGPPLTSLRRNSRRTSSVRMHPMASLASISSNDTSDPGPSSQYTNGSYAESVRSSQSTASVFNAFTPPLSPKRPRINTSYIRPMAADGAPTQTPLVEVGPALSVRTDRTKSPPPPYRAPSPVKPLTPPPASASTTSSARRRMQSFYALAEARSDQIMHDTPPQSSIHPALRDMRPNSALNIPPRPTSALTAPIPVREHRSSSSSSSPYAPPYREARSHSAFAILTEDTATSAFAPRPSTSTEPESYSAYHILPEDHTNRPPEQRQSLPEQIRRRPVSPRKSVTDTFKEAVLSFQPESRYDSMKEVTGASIPRLRHSLDTDCQQPQSSVDVPRALPQDLYRPMTANPAVTQMPQADYERAYDSGIQLSPQSQRPNIRHHHTYSDTSKEIIANIPMASKSVADIHLAALAEPQSHVEMIRMRNLRRRRGTKQPLRIVNA